MLSVQTDTQPQPCGTGETRRDRERRFRGKSTRNSQ
ncbi:MAG: hypothetical protein KDB65_04225 [Calditrichaeota bacterium]|nr:hypothetical protein [Calditrichota bacterium]MCB9368869.1 hypothetical protein [Calditrichota bacterium]